MTDTAAAQSRTGFAVSRLEPAERGAGWFVVDALDFRGRARPSFGVTLDYAFKPLAVYDADQNERLALVRHQLFVHAGGSLVLAERLRLAVNVPVAAYQDGDSTIVWERRSPAHRPQRSATSASPPTCARWARRGPPFVLGLDARLAPPGFARSSLAMARRGSGPRCSPAATPASSRGRSVRQSSRSRDDAYAGAPLGSEFFGAAGAGVRAGRFFFGPEVFASTVAGRRGGVPERARDPRGRRARSALRAAPWLRLAAAAGSGLTRGYGSPALRALASLEWVTPIAVGPPTSIGTASPIRSTRAPTTAGSRAAIRETRQARPRTNPREDTDGNGIWDNDDACPALRGLQTADPMTNGCPAGTPRPLAVVTTTEIRIEQEVRVRNGNAACW